MRERERNVVKSYARENEGVKTQVIQVYNNNNVLVGSLSDEAVNVLAKNIPKHQKFLR